MQKQEWEAQGLGSVLAGPQLCSQESPFMCCLLWKGAGWDWQQMFLNNMLHLDSKGAPLSCMRISMIAGSR